MSTPPMVVSLPLREVPKSLIVDLRIYEVGRKIHRNVLMARDAVVPPANLTMEQTLTIPHRTSATVPSHTVIGTPGNTLTVMTASAPLRVRVTSNTGVHDLGLMTLLVFTSEILSLVLENESDDATKDADVEIIHA